VADNFRHAPIGVGEAALISDQRKSPAKTWAGPACRCGGRAFLLVAHEQYGLASLCTSQKVPCIANGHLLQDQFRSRHRPTVSAAVPGAVRPCQSSAVIFIEIGDSGSSPGRHPARRFRQPTTCMEPLGPAPEPRRSPRRGFALGAARPALLTASIRSRLLSRSLMAKWKS
jgi:hypothetical protein